MTGGAVRVGDKVRFQGRVHMVVSIGWEHVTLLDDSLVSVAVLRGFLLGDPTFEVLDRQVTSSRTVEPLAQLGLVDEAELQRVRELERHLLEVYAPELAGEARPDYDSGLPIGRRERNKVRELAALGIRVSLSTLRRWRAQHDAEGLIGLLDHRHLRRIQPIGQVDDRVVEALKEVLNRQRDLSTGTRGRVILQAQQLLDERHGAGVIPLPSRATLYRVIAVLAKGTYAFDHAPRAAPTPTARTAATHAPTPPGPVRSCSSTRPAWTCSFSTTTTRSGQWS